MLYKDKSIVWVMWPAEQVLVATALYEIGIDYGVFHGKLTSSNCAKLLCQFTKEHDKCMVLICTYSVNSAGLNLQSLCHNVHLFMPATSALVHDQAIGRVCRIGQQNIVIVYDYHVPGTFNVYLVNRNRNKAIPGIVTEMTSGLNDEGDLSSNGIINTQNWVIRDGKLIHLEKGQNTHDGDNTDPDAIMAAIVDSLQGLDGLESRDDL
jgi:hypothetical protein